MGLDMYLTKRTYLGANYEHNNVKGVIELTQGKDNTPVNIKINRISEINENVGYWRKANHIHAWFVEKVQDGEDECQDSYVSIDKLKELLSDCESVLDNKDKAADLMPTAIGFFFGGTDYDEYYFDQIQHTIDIIKPLLEELEADKTGDIYYRSSW